MKTQVSFIFSIIQAFVKYIILIILILPLSAISAIAQENNDNNVTLPTQLGQYHVGYTEFHACDNSRISLINDDPIFHPGGTLVDCVRGPVTSGKLLVARPVSFRVWYPTSAQSGPSVSYSDNNDIYPNVGVMATTLTTPSPNGALRGVPVVQNSNGFPIIIFTPGSTGTGTEFASVFNEILASHGFIFVGLDHANDAYPSEVGFDASGLYSYPATGPFPRVGLASDLILRIGDVRFAIDEMLRRDSNIPQNNLFNRAIDQTKIGLQSYSFGGPTILGEAGGIQSLGIPPDSRVKAIFKMDGTIYGDPIRGNNSSFIFNFQTPTSSDLANIKIPVLLMFNLYAPDDLRAFQDLGSHNVTMVRLATPTHISTSEPWCDIVKSRLDHLATATPLDLFQVQLYNLSGYVDNPYINCSSSLFTNHSLTDGQTMLFGNANFGNQPPLLGLQPAAGETPSIYTMPLEMLNSELSRIEKFYVVAFFEVNLARHTQYQQFLTPNYATNNFPPFVKTWQNQYEVANNPLDIHAGDKITFSPFPAIPLLGYLYRVSYSQGNQMVPLDSNDTILYLGDADQTIVPFSAGFPFLGTTFGNSNIISPFLSALFGTTNFINNISVNTNGNLTLGTDIPEILGTNLNYAQLDTSDALIGSGVYRIAPFFADIETDLVNSIVTSKETSDGRLIITYTKMTRYPFELDNLNLGSIVTTGTSTFQVILYGNTSNSPGKIEFIYGQLDPNTNSPDRLVATVGIAKGNAWSNYPNTPIGLKAGFSVDFTALKQYPIILPVGAIYETFTNGITINK